MTDEIEDTTLKIKFMNRADAIMELYYTEGLSDSVEKFVFSVDSQRMMLHKNHNHVVESFYLPEWMEGSQ